MTEIFIVKNGKTSEFYGGYFENVAAFDNYQDAEEFKIRAELIQETKKEILKRYNEFLYRKNYNKDKAAQLASDKKFSYQEIEDFQDLDIDEWEIDMVQLLKGEI